jgi:hypothetical protein
MAWHGSRYSEWHGMAVGIVNGSWLCKWHGVVGDIYGMAWRLVCKRHGRALAVVWPGLCSKHGIMAGNGMAWRSGEGSLKFER